jgi:hypothetical protein
LAPARAKPRIIAFIAALLALYSVNSGHGRLPGYEHDLDLQVWFATEAELRTRRWTLPNPVGGVLLGDVQDNFPVIVLGF